MYKRMLVPLDGSQLAEAVFPYAKELAGRLNIDVTLLYVCSRALSEFVPMHQAYVKQATENVGRQIQEVQKKTGIRPAAKPVTVRGEVVVGSPPEEILRYADENQVDLILMATHGRSGMRRWVMGNVADKVLRAAKTPVLLVRSGIPDETPYDQWPKRTILVPLDGSELAEKVLPHVEALAKQGGTELVDVVLIRVCEPLAVPSYYAPEVAEPTTINWGEFIQEDTIKSKRVAEEYLAGVEKRLKASHISVRSEVLGGKAGDEIADYANKHPFNLIVMATHGRSGLSRWVYGSVADNVLQGVCSPILLIRPR